MVVADQRSRGLVCLGLEARGVVLAQQSNIGGMGSVSNSRARSGAKSVTTSKVSSLKVSPSGAQLPEALNFRQRWAQCQDWPDCSYPAYVL
jgi:hypothetical protein